VSEVVVIYESMFGNTEQVARAIADRLGGDAAIYEVGAAPLELPPDTQLLVIGGPTHAFGMTRPSTRRDAAGQTDQLLVSQRIGVREWIGAATLPDRHVRFAAFDTHAEHPRTLRHVGSAARSITRALKRRGLQPAVEAEHFWVEGTLGPLTSGEIERARSWADTLTGLLARR
jgi:hypothetical protein